MPRILDVGIITDTGTSSMEPIRDTFRLVADLSIPDSKRKGYC
jgi:hypothetical protein